VIGTGGTISILGRNALDLYEYSDFGRVLDVDELLMHIPEVHQEAEIVPIQFRAILSTEINQRIWRELHEKVHEVVRQHPNIDGLVITHGTATIEETAYFLNLTSTIAQTIVLVAAQRPISGLSSDAPLNLVNAVRVAKAIQCRGLGVLVVLNDEIHAAREVAKSSAHRVNAFQSLDFGPLGYADPDGEVVIYRAPSRKHAPNVDFDIRDVGELPRVDIAYSYAGADNIAIQTFLELGARGIVMAGFGTGQITPIQEEALLKARSKGVVVVQSTRVGSGRTDLREAIRTAGFIDADNLSPQKARILTMLALTVTDDPERIQTLFNEY